MDFQRSETEAMAEVMLMAQTVSMANGFLNMTGSLDADINAKCDDLWHKDLDSKFTGKWVVGSGATACVFLAYDDTNTLVAVKVGKKGSAEKDAFAKWKAECDEMQAMRMNGCRAGKAILQMHEQYLPTCTDIG